MNDEANFELVWLDKVGGPRPEPCLRFEMVDEARSTRSQCVGALKVCSNPRCGCRVVGVSCVRADSQAETPRSTECWEPFSLDLASRSLELAATPKADPAVVALAEHVQRRLRATDWERLYRWFRGAKLDVIRAAQPEAIEVANLPDTGDGRMVGFAEVFPADCELDFQFEERRWNVYDEYCVELGCKCGDAVLSFYQYESNALEGFVSAAKSPALRYYYRTGAAKIMEAKAMAERLLAALKAAHPLLDAELQRRHELMRALYVRHASEKMKAARDVAAEVPVRRSRVGRNEPCPCGSGKKFKRCCGAN